MKLDELENLRAENQRLKAENERLEARRIEQIDDAWIEQIEGVRPPARGGIPADPETKAIDGRVAEMIQYLDAHDGKLPEEEAT